MAGNPPMIFRGLDSSGDWQFGQGYGSYAHGQSAVLLNVKTALLTFLADAFWNATFGIDWINLLGTKGTQNAILASVRQMIAQCEGVTGISAVSFSANTQTRRMTIQATVSTVYSQSGSVSAQITI